MSRVKYYSTLDLSLHSFMPKISDILRNYNENSFVTINDVLEFYNVTQIIDAQRRNG